MARVTSMAAGPRSIKLAVSFVLPFTPGTHPPPQISAVIPEAVSGQCPRIRAAGKIHLHILQGISQQGSVSKSRRDEAGKFAEHLARICMQQRIDSRGGADAGVSDVYSNSPVMLIFPVVKTCPVGPAVLEDIQNPSRSLGIERGERQSFLSRKDAGVRDAVRRVRRRRRDEGELSCRLYRFTSVEVRVRRFR